jgi:hypothetical protein
MMPLVVLLLFAGMVMVMHGIYAEKLRDAQRDVRVEYRFIPRTLYEEQMAQTDLLGTFNNMFDRDSPWLPDAAAPAVGPPPHTGRRPSGPAPTTGGGT